MRTLAALLLPALALAACAADKEPVKERAVKPAEPGTLVILDASGKEQKLKAWKFAGGTRRLGWLAPERPAGKAAGANKGPEEEPAAPATPAGPEALEFRAETDIQFVEGVLTLIPLDRLRSLDYDNEMDTVTVRVAAGPGPDETLTGSTKYRKINKLVLEAEVDKGDLGVAEVRYFGGVPRGIRGIRFHAPRPPAAPPAGRPAVVTSADGKNKTTHKVRDLLPLYRFADGGEKLLPTLMFRKTLQIDVARVKKITAAESDRDDASWQVQLKGGSEETLTLLTGIEAEGRKATLQGLVGQVPAGYKLFPVAAIAEITFDGD
jgi:hypothetical protein